jgi:hypothetical protein
MNHDPHKFCHDCRRPKPREGFRVISYGMHGQPVRYACADCYRLITDKREAARRRVSA